MRSYSPIEFISIMWLSVMDKYLQLSKQGINMQAVKYEDMVRNPEKAMRLILKDLGFSDVEIYKALKTFSKDSQAGSALARESLEDVTFPQESKDEVSNLLAMHSEIRNPNYTVPGTIEI
ncbi:MAG: hypothetical protein ABI721_00925 [Candidatus Dojkabacteria bacterium]